jgi:hypothetical protein
MTPTVTGSELDEAVLEAAAFATRYEFECKAGMIIVELVDDATDDWVVRTARSAGLFAEKELVRGRVPALQRARVLRAK